MTPNNNNMPGATVAILEDSPLKHLVPMKPPAERLKLPEGFLPKAAPKKKKKNQGILQRMTRRFQQPKQKKDPWQAWYDESPYMFQDQLKEIHLPQHDLVEDKACAKKIFEEDSFVESTRVGSYNLLQRLGSGAFGHVFVGQSTVTSSQPVAIKVLSKRAIRKQAEGREVVKTLRPINNEIGILREHSHHPNVIGFHEALHGRHNIYLVMEQATSDLASCMHTLGPIQPDFYQQVMKGILTGLEYLHRHGVYHLDVKPHNVLIVSRYSGERVDASSVRLCDFGLSKTIASHLPEWKVGDTPMHVKIAPGSYMGTHRFMCPELRLRKGANARQADMWSVGCTLLNIMDCLPREFGVRDPAQYEVNVKEFLESQSISISGGDAELVHDLLFQHLLLWNAQDRDTSEEALSHPWFQYEYENESQESYFESFQPEHGIEL
ncbi:activated protein kinase HOG1 [Seminavis robusta]|uniref:Activated protein kinase HOG1 n=1 Tax=Seminavis robusta TaxID=568900 RepID=A0A9N8HK66_9STRA|nr:activated protein kinase HOG1 [Seminavis robusta]|eukprot:Sro595_g172710.1 activated protein kinase HOG1 (436) ;mRNA; r:52874-54181